MIEMSWVSKAQAIGYYEKDDYYQERGTMPSEWGGSLAAELGLVGAFDREKFSAALDGKFDSDLRLVQAHSGARAALDIVPSAPKTISEMALAAGDTRLIAAHHEACDAVMSRAASLLRTRITENGVTKSVQVSGIAFARFLHDTSREGDPHLHSHHVVFNVARTSDGRLISLDNSTLIRWKHALDAEYKSILKEKCEDLGYTTRPTKSGFEIEGISQELLSEHSKRKAQIDADLKNRGSSRELASGAERAAAFYRKRATKKDFDRDSLREYWRLAADERGGLPDIPQAQNARPEELKETRAARADQALDEAFAHFTERESVVSSHSKLLAQAVKRSNYTLQLSDVEAALARAQSAGKVFSKDVSNPDQGPRMVHTTREVVETEQAIVSAYKVGRNSVDQLATSEQAEKGIARMEEAIAERVAGSKEAVTDEIRARCRLTVGQRRLVESVSTGRDQVVVVEGDAGTGKSTAMEAVQEVARSQGFRVVGLAPSGQAVEALKSAGIESRTTQGVTTRDPFYLPAPDFWKSIDKRTVVVVDEAGLTDARSMRQILENVQSRGSRLVVVGDSKQFKSVEAGQVMRQLRDAAGNDLVRLDEMRRGKTDEMRALHRAARDDPGNAIDQMLATGKVISIACEVRRQADLADAYSKLPAEERSETRVLCSSNAQRISLNEQIRDRLGLTGQGEMIKTFERKDLTQVERCSHNSYELGDAIRFERREGEFKRGEIWTVTGLEGGKITVSCSSGESKGFDPRTQGQSVSVGLIEDTELARGDRIRMTSAKKDPEGNGWDNGERGELVAISSDHLHVRFDSGKMVQIPRNGDRRPFEIRHGYAQTGHSAQGATSPRVFLLLDPSMDWNAFYTNVTRSAKYLTSWCDARVGKQLNKLKKAVSVSRETLLGSDIAPEKTRHSVPPEVKAWRDEVRRLTSRPGVKPDPDREQAGRVERRSGAELLPRLQALSSAPGQVLRDTQGKIHGVSVRKGEREQSVILSKQAQEAAAARGVDVERVSGGDTIKKKIDERPEVRDKSSRIENSVTKPTEVQNRDNQTRGETQINKPRMR